MLRDPAPDLSEIEQAARAAAWEIPKSLAAVACHERDLAEVTRILPIGVISATVDGSGCIALPDPAGPGRTRQIGRSLAGRTAVLGPSVAPNRLAESWQLARNGFEASEAGALPSGRLVTAEEHLVDLALFRSLNIHPQTARYRIARLREFFGDDLDRPDRRLALELSLRTR